MYEIQRLDNGRYALVVLPKTMDPAYGRVHIDHMAGAADWEVGQMMGGN